MKKKFSKILFNTLKTNFLKNPTDLLCSLSGGQDSIFLLIFLYHLRALFPISLFSLSCNHFWGRNSFYVERELIKLNFLLDLEFSLFIPEKKNLTEERARFWRQKNFYRTGVFLNIKKIAIGHTFSDQIETSFWHLFRGTSPSGLPKVTDETYLNKPYFNQNFDQKVTRNILKTSKIVTKKFYKKKFNFSTKDNLNSIKKFKNKSHIGNQVLIATTPFIYWQKCHQFSNFRKSSHQKNTVNKFFFRQSDNYLSNITLIRPLLSYHRNDLQIFINENHLPILIDKTNQSLKLTRNKIRLVVLPTLHLYFSQKSDLQIKKYLTIVTGEQLFFTQVISKILQERSAIPSNMKSFKKIPIFLKERCLHFILGIYLKKQIDYKTLYYLLTE